MLMSKAWLRRQDCGPNEAALDLGTRRVQGFRHITLPFLKATTVTAAVIAFLQGVEHDTTTIFSIGGDHSLVAEIGAREATA